MIGSYLFLLMIDWFLIGSGVQQMVLNSIRKSAIPGFTAAYVTIPYQIAGLIFKVCCTSINYTVSQKHHATLHLCITSAYVDRFYKFFHCWIQQGICNKTLVMFSTTPYISCYSTLVFIAKQQRDSVSMVNMKTKFEGGPLLSLRCSNWGVNGGSLRPRL